MRFTIQSTLLALSVPSTILAALPDGDANDQPMPNAVQTDSTDHHGHHDKDYDHSKYSACFNYFYQKDGCVFSAAEDDKRCSVDGKRAGHEIPPHLPMVIRSSSHKHSTWTKENGMFSGSDRKGNSVLAAGSRTTVTETQDNSQEIIYPPRLVKRYDSLDDSFTVGGGDGICGNYTVDKPGVCIFASPNSTDGSGSGGWLNGTFTSACGRQIWIERTNPNVTVYAPVVDGCSFKDPAVDVGCFRIAFTQATFDALKPTEQEKKDLKIRHLKWDFDNIYGNNTRNAAP